MWFSLITIIQNLKTKLIILIVATHLFGRNWCIFNENYELEQETFFTIFRLLQPPYRARLGTKDISRSKLWLRLILQDLAFRFVHTKLLNFFGYMTFTFNLWQTLNNLNMRLSPGLLMSRVLIWDQLHDFLTLKNFKDPKT